MPSVDMKFVRNRQHEIRRVIQRSSPALIYSGTIGIVIIARSKKTLRPRIGKILDRLAIVSRGELSGSDQVHDIAALEARTRAHFESKEDVRGSDPVRAISEVLSNRYHAFFGPPLAIESCLVQLNDTPDTDYMAHIDPDGSVQPFEHVLFMGSIEKPHEPHARNNEHEDEASHTRDHLSRELLKQFNDQLERQWRDYGSVEDLLEALKAIPELESMFAPPKRRDIVLLERAALLKQDYRNIFRRLT
jgi:hypothetical protein